MRILIVDDNKYAIEQISNYLKLINIDFDIHEAYNGQEAIEKIHDNTYDLILLDISMPDISGIEVLKYIRIIDKNVKVIIISIWTTEGQTEAAYKEGVDDFLPKPIDLDKLMEWIGKIKG